ncbi:hypothetical protein Tco_1205474 [Tanacetum coccineum]
MVRLWWLWWPQPARPPPQWWRQAAEHSEAPPRGCTATARHHMVWLWWLYRLALADPPPTARHGGGSGWKSRRSCGGRGSCVGGWRDEVEWLERVKKCGKDSPEKSTGKVFHRRLLTGDSWPAAASRKL